MSKFIFAFFFALILFSRVCHAQNSEFTPDVPYQEAVPSFLERIQTAVQDIVDVAAVRQWFEETGARFNEFASDFIDGVKEWAQAPLGSFGIGKIKDSTDKWNTVANNLPGLEDMRPVITPLLNEAVKDLPELEPVNNTGVPSGNIYNWYQQMEAANPWGTAALFKVERLDENIVKHLSKKINEQTREGVSSRTVIFKEKEVKKNGKPVFYILVKNDKVVEKNVAAKDKTLMHEVLRNMKQNNDDPQFISLIQQIVDTIDSHLGTPAVQTSSQSAQPSIKVLKGGKSIQ